MICLWEHSEMVVMDSNIFQKMI